MNTCYLVTTHNNVILAFQQSSYMVFVSGQVTLYKPIDALH